MHFVIQIVTLDREYCILGGVIVMTIEMTDFGRFEPTLQEMAAQGRWRYETKPYTLTWQRPGLLVEIAVSECK